MQSPIYIEERLSTLKPRDPIYLLIQTEEGPLPLSCLYLQYNPTTRELFCTSGSQSHPDISQQEGMFDTRTDRYIIDLAEIIRIR